MALPQLSDEQRKEALAKAAEARKARAALRDQIKSGEKTVADVLADVDDPVVARMRVSMLIESLPGYGKAKAAKLYTATGEASYYADKFNGRTTASGEKFSNTHGFHSFSPYAVIFIFLWPSGTRR